MSAVTPQVALSPFARLPRVSVAAAAVIGFYLSISPSSLPRGAVLQGVVSALFVVMCVQAAGTARRVPRLVGRSRVVGLLVLLVVAVALGVWGHHVLEAARDRAGMPGLGWRYWAAVLAIVAAGLLLRHAGRCAWRGRLWSRAVARPLAAAVVCVGVVLAGGPAHGVGPDDTMWIMQQRSPEGAARSFARILPGEGPQERAERAVDRLVHEGGLRRSRIVVVLPTGSGWVDPEFLAGVEQRFGPDVATVSMQYDAAPSWYSYLLHREQAADAARHLFAAVAGRVEEMPAAQRPDLHVYGESLGALAGQAVFVGPGGREARQEVCSVLWVGPPGGQRAGLPRESVVANPDDPVVHTRWRDLALPPEDTQRWLPVVSSVHDAVDFVGSLHVPEGSGHRYGTSQVESLRDC